MAEGYALNYIAVVLAAVVGLLAMGGMLLGSLILAPKRQSEAKELPFEFAMEAGQLLRVSLEGAVG